MNANFGLTIQRIRRASGRTLNEVAEDLNVSAAFLSAIENGKKRVPDDFVARLGAALPGVSEIESQIEALASQSREQVILSLPHASVEDASLANAIAKKFNSLSEAQKARMKDILEGHN